MRPSKSRSRSKSNRSRSMGNIVNRVFDSSGPEGKVRGTPQQIIEKYTQLARDAHLGNDRVAAENFQQHAEHYTRLLGEALREMEARREQHEGQQPQAGNGQRGDRPRDQGDQQPRREALVDEFSDREETDRDDRGAVEVIDLVGDEPEDEGEGESTLVETPEEKPAAKPRRPRRPRGPRNAGEAQPSPDAAEEARAPAAE